MRSEKSYTKSENHFLRKSNFKLSGWKISILSFEWKCADDVPKSKDVHEKSVLSLQIRTKLQSFPIE